MQKPPLTAEAPQNDEVSQRGERSKVSASSLRSLIVLRRLCGEEAFRRWWDLILKDHQPTGRLENISASRQRRLTPTRHPASERNSIVADATWETICAHRGLKPTAKLRRRAAAGFASTPRLPPHNRTASDQCRQAGWLAPIRSSVSKLPALAS